jgi:simple sugar transport system permease protein
MSKVFPDNAWLPRLTDFSKTIPLFRGLTLHLGLVFGIVAAVIVWIILYRSQWGYEIRLIGDNPRAAQYSGIPIMRNTVLVMMLSGALAGLAGMSEISGVVHRLQGAISPGYGFTGIIVAWLAKLNPFIVIVVSILFGALILAGREIQPSGVPKLIQGIILVCLISSDFLMRYRVYIAHTGEVK